MDISIELYITLILLGVVSIFSIISYACYLLYQSLEYKFNDYFKFIAFFPFYILFYYIFTAFYPTDDFYEEQFKSLSGIELPKDYKLIYKDSSYPDIHGDFYSLYIIKVNQDYYDTLPIKLLKNNFKKYTYRKEPFRAVRIPREYQNVEISYEYHRRYENKKTLFFYIGFINNDSSVVIFRSDI